MTPAKACQDEPPSGLKATLRRVLPAQWVLGLYRHKRAWEHFLRWALSVLPAYGYDLARFIRYSATATRNTPAKLLALIVKDYHRLEKGLALPRPRPGFGLDVAYELVQRCQQYLARFGPALPVADAAGALHLYRAFQAVNGIDLGRLEDAIRALEQATGFAPERNRAGVIQVTAQSIREAVAPVDQAFFSRRHSVRQFAEGPIQRDLIMEALRRAERTPAVCNRQGARVHVLLNPEAKRQALALQNGNRGFGDTAPVIFIVTVDLSIFVSVGERYQCWIDGGMYAMSLIYALHSLALGTCSLNWSTTPGVDRRLHKRLAIPRNEQVIMMIAAGHLREHYAVAASPRLPLESTVRFVD